MRSSASLADGRRKVLDQALASGGRAGTAESDLSRERADGCDPPRAVGSVEVEGGGWFR